eukprot:gene19089-22861_t
MKQPFISTPTFGEYATSPNADFTTYKSTYFISSLVNVANQHEAILSVKTSTIGDLNPFTIPVLGNSRNATYFAHILVPSNTKAEVVLSYSNPIGIDKYSLVNITSTSDIPPNPVWDLTDYSTDEDVTLCSLNGIQGGDGVTVFFGYNNVDIPLAFPFGLGQGTAKSNSLSLTSLTSAYISYLPLSIQYYTLSILNMTPSLIVKDQLPPNMYKFEILSLGTYTKVIRVSFTDNLSGLYSVSMLGETAFESALAYGNITNGVLEFQVNLQPKIYVHTDSNIYNVNILDQALNSFTTQTNQFLPSLNVMPQLNVDLSRTIDDIAYFRFDKTVVNVTQTSVRNTLYLNITNADVNMRPQIILTYNKLARYQLDRDYTFTGYWDIQAMMFVIPFRVPMNIFEGYLSYTLFTDPELNNQQLTSINGSQIQVISENCDQLPPLVTKVTAFPSTQVHGAATEIGWDLEIVDTPNGFKEGYMVISSDYNPVPWTFNFTSANKTGGDIYTGTYSFRIPLTDIPRNQTFTFDLVLVDLAENIALSNPPPNTYHITPLFNILQSPATIQQLTIHTTTSSSLIDTTPPVLCAFMVDQTEVDVGKKNRTISFKFNVCDDNSGVNTRNAPLVYLNSLYNTRSSCQSIHIGGTANNATFQCKLNVSYGFGAGNSLYLSVHGLFDNHLNINGYSTIKLGSMSFVNKISRKYSYNRHAPIEFLKGGLLTVYGQKFGMNGSDVTYRLEDQHGNTVAPIKSAPFFSSIIFTINIPPFTKSTPAYYLTITVGGATSNTLVINPLPKPPQCPGTPMCSSNGDCIDDICLCKTGWTGPEWYDHHVKINVEITANVQVKGDVYANQIGLDLIVNHYLEVPKPISEKKMQFLGKSNSKLTA